MCERERDILNNDVADSRDHTKTSALDDTERTLTKKSLVRCDSDTENTSVVTAVSSVCGQKLRWVALTRSWW